MRCLKKNLKVAATSGREESLAEICRFDQNANTQLFPGQEEVLENRTEGGMITVDLLRAHRLIELSIA